MHGAHGTGFDHKNCHTVFPVWYLCGKGFINADMTSFIACRFLLLSFLLLDSFLSDFFNVRNFFVFLTITSVATHATTADANPIPKISFPVIPIILNLIIHILYINCM